MEIPEALTFAMSKLPGWSVNTYRMLPQALTSATPDSYTQWTLPENQLVDLRTFAPFADIVGIRGPTTAAGVLDAGFVNQAVLPQWTDSLIDQIIVSVNGAQIDASCIGYNHVKRFFNQYTKGNRQSADGVLGLGLPIGPAASTSLVNVGSTAAPLVGLSSSTAVRAGVTATDAASINSPNVDFWANTISGNNTLQGFRIMFSDFIGFLGCKKVIDTSLIGRIDIIIKWAPKNVVLFDSASNSATADATYRLYNLHAFVNVCDMDPMYYNAMAASLAVSPLQINYKRFITSPGSITGSGSVRFSVATQSLDAVYAWLLRPTPSRLASAAGAAGVLRADASGGYYSQNNHPFFQHLSADAGTGGYIQSSQLSVNSTLYPQFALGLEQLYYQLLNTFRYLDEKRAAGLNNLNLVTWMFDHTTMSHRFSFGNHEDLTTLSGMDTRGLQTSASWNIVTQGGALNANTLIVLETTATLNVGQFRAVDVVY